MINASETTVIAATKSLGRAALFDDRITAGDSARIAAWAEALEPFGFELPDLLAAVTAHYQAAGSDAIRPGDLIAGARKLRGERAEREKGHAVAALPAGDPQSGGLPIAAEGEPVWAAYDQHGAVDLPCETCGAGEREACVNLATRLTRKIPCVSRLKAGCRKVRR